jgi:chromate transporter
MAGRIGMNPFLGSFLCWLGMFAPGVMLIFALLPFWGKFRNVTTYRKMMPGASFFWPQRAGRLLMAAYFSRL